MMNAKVWFFLIVILALINPLESPALEFGYFYPLYLGASWTYQSVENPENTLVQSVCCPFEIEEGQPAMIYDLDEGVQVACWKDGSSVIWYGY